MKTLIVKFTILFLALTATLSCVYAQYSLFTAQEVQWIADKVFENECGQRDECLLEWNHGEEFLSLGIGHFIWYPKGVHGPFEESFKKLLEYLKKSGEKLPVWLDVNPYPDCPWPTKEEFWRQRQSDTALELEQFLVKTKSKQANFLVSRLDSALPLLLKSVSVEKRPTIREKFNSIISTQEGTYAVIDYINFKGLGVTPSERYKGKGWGLLQILLEMDHSQDAKQSLQEFVKVAKKVLQERVQNSPPERNEGKWLMGWQSRINSYLNPINKSSL